jgi:hypothetical protein
MLSQESARDPKRSFRLLHIDRLGKHQIGADAVGLGYACLSLDYGDGQRALIETGISCALEEQRGVLFVSAIHDDGVVVVGHQPLNGAKGFVCGFNREVQFGEDLADNTSQFLVGRE